MPLLLSYRTHLPPFDLSDSSFGMNTSLSRAIEPSASAQYQASDALS